MTQPQRLTFTTGRLHLASPTRHPRYACTLIQAGETANHWTLPAEVLAASLPLWQGVPCQIDHPGWFEPASLMRYAGTFETPVLLSHPSDGGDSGGATIEATLRIADTPSGELLTRIFNACLEDEADGLIVPPVGLSAVLWLSFEHDDDDSTGGVTPPLHTATQIHMVESVDAVLHPAAGGKVQRVLNSFNPEPHPGIVVSSLGTSTHQGANPHERSISMPENITVDGGNATYITPPTVGVGSPNPPADPPDINLRDALASLQRVTERINSLTEQVEHLTTVAADQVAEHTITGMGNAPRDQMSIRMGRTGIEQVDLALQALLAGHNPPSGIQPLTGIRELYLLLSGDYEMTGRYNPERVFLATVNSSTMAALVANALNKVVVTLFQEYPKWWAPIVTEMDFSTLQAARWITLGGVGELPTVTEGAAYTELTWDDNTETASFAKKGGYLGLTIEAIDKDDTNRLRMAPAALAQAAWLTLNKSVSALFTSASGAGGNLADGTALFATARGNLGTTALSHAAWNTTRIAMRKFTELNSSERLGALVAPKFLLVPPDLELTGLQIMATEHTPGSANYNANPFSEGSERDQRLAFARDRVVVVDLWTDADNWAAVADPRLYPSIGIGYRYGRTPEIFSVASPTAGLMFSNDVMPVKVRFFYATGPVDWRGMYKHNV